MTDNRPYRAGLGLPEAITIRSHALQPKSRPVIDPDQDSSTFTHDPFVNWKEWNINPAKHGPERFTRPPVFVQAQVEYDELGRAAVHGVEVVVEEGKVRRVVESGERVAEWYKAVASTSIGRTNLSKTYLPEDIEAGPSRPKPVAVETGEAGIQRGKPLSDVEPEAEAGPSRSRSSSPEIIAISPPSTTIPLSRPRHRSRPRAKPEAEPKPFHLINPHKQNYFHYSLSRLISPFQTPTQTHPPSISTLLNIASTQNRVRVPPPPKYVLGPDNKGYVLLRERGWEGGGLGRPEGWVPAPPPAHSTPRSKSKSRSRSRSVESEQEPELDIHGNHIIDLTTTPASSDGESETEEPERITISGPGRTAPIPTLLKLDRLGLGHHRVRNDLRKVTHTAEEILQAQRRARYRGSGAGPGKTELDKKGKIRWKERERKESDERLKIQTALR